MEIKVAFLVWKGWEGMDKLNWIDLITERLRDYSEGEIWTDGGSEILVRTESAANTVADMLTTLYRTQGEEVERNNEVDRYTGWWYVNIG